MGLSRDNSEPQPTEITTPADLLAEGMIEALVRSQRIPHLTKAIVAPGEKEQRQEMWCFVPPQGVTFQSQVLWNELGAFCFIVGGEEIPSQIVILDDQQSEEVARRKNEELERMQQKGLV